MPVAVETDVQVGAGHIYSLATIVMAIGSISGYISPNLQTLNVVHSGTVDRIKNQAGLTSSIIGNDDQLECTFDFIPEGTSRALALLSGGLPKLASPVTISGAQKLAAGPWTDAINSPGQNDVAVNAAPWIYEGGGKIIGSADSKWTASLPLRRYQGILSPTVITG